MCAVRLKNTAYIRLLLQHTPDERSLEGRNQEKKGSFNSNGIWEALEHTLSLIHFFNKLKNIFQSLAFGAVHYT